MSGAAPVRWLVLAAAVGGAVGALGRWAVGAAVPAGGGFPWPTFLVNVTGALVLALLPASRTVRRIRWLPVLLGTGVLGGFTTLSAFADETRDLLTAGRGELAAAYVASSLAVGMVAVRVAHHWTSPAARAEFADEEGDE